MSERPPLTLRKRELARESRLMPLTVAGLVCLVTAFALGYGGWYFFGTHGPARGASAAEPVRQTAAEPEPAEAAEPAPAPFRRAPAGELPVEGGEITLGGPEAGAPLRRELVGPFLVAETEVTNEQYREFVKARSYPAPDGWKNGEFPPGAALEPVTGVTWADAAEYCKWLSEQTGAEVRLPTEAEWEMAARGREARKYPWGGEWDERAADSSEGQGRVRAVKSFPAGRSPAGAYDMAGNVWEWVADEARDEEGRLKSKDGVAYRIIKGGSAREPRAFVTATARYEVLADKKSPTLGFRYVVVRRGAAEGRQE